MEARESIEKLPTWKLQPMSLQGKFLEFTYSQAAFKLSQ